MKKNICIAIAKTNGGYSASDLSPIVQEKAFIIDALCKKMQKDEILSLVDGKYYLNIPIDY